MLHYCLTLEDPKGHYFNIRLRFEYPASQGVNKDTQGLVLYLPAWIPGSYLIREFSRHVMDVRALVDAKPCSVEKINKDHWRIDVPSHASKAKPRLVECSWRVYAWDLSVRGAHFDESHAFLNATSAFLVPKHLEDQAIELQIARPQPQGSDSAATWTVACGLNSRAKRKNGGCLALPPGGQLEFQAKNYDELIDHPLEMGELQSMEFEVHGVVHCVAFYGADPDLDLKRICTDLQPVCKAQIELFEPVRHLAPFDRYWFLVHATSDGYGGLEHRNSTALLCARKDLPQRGVEKAPEGYSTFLGLCSHEYFHAWHVKRIKPAAFVPYNLHAENYTQLLWVFEGFTSYYDDLMLARAGFLDSTGYCKTLAKSVDQVLNRPGRLVQTVAESSFDAWTKYYRQDENAINSIVSYYAKGALVAFCLDVILRQRSRGKKSLDDAMRLLWQEHGLTGIGVEEQAMPALIERATGIDVSQELFSWTQTTDELPLEACFKALGYQLEGELKAQTVYLGLTGTFNEAGMHVKQVSNGSPAHAAGVSAGDVLVALDNRKFTETHYKRTNTSRAPGEKLKIMGFRAERLCEFEVVLEAARPQSWLIKPIEKAPRAARLKAPWNS